jgi:ATP:corrinoid adenosyltransferase
MKNVTKEPRVVRRGKWSVLIADDFAIWVTVQRWPVEASVKIFETTPEDLRNIGTMFIKAADDLNNIQE